MDQKEIRQQLDYLQEKFPEWSLGFGLRHAHSLRGRARTSTNSVLEIDATHRLTHARSPTFRTVWDIEADNKETLQRAIRRLWQWLEEQ